jgi:hypothetical protein
MYRFPSSVPVKAFIPAEDIKVRRELRELKEN